MSLHVLFNFLNDFGKKRQYARRASIISPFHKDFDK